METPGRIVAQSYALCKLRRIGPALKNKEDILRTLNNVQCGWFDEFLALGA
jgi:hypothetical protein